MKTLFFLAAAVSNSIEDPFVFGRQLAADAAASAAAANDDDDDGGGGGGGGGDDDDDGVLGHRDKYHFMPSTHAHTRAQPCARKKLSR